MDLEMSKNNEKKVEEIKKAMDMMVSELARKGFYGEYAIITKIEDGNVQGYEKIVKQKFV